MHPQSFIIIAFMLLKLKGDENLPLPPPPGCGPPKKAQGGP